MRDNLLVVKIKDPLDTTEFVRLFLERKKIIIKEGNHVHN